MIDRASTRAAAGTARRRFAALSRAASHAWSTCFDAWMGRAVPGESWFRDRLADAWRSPGGDAVSGDASGMVPEGIDELTVLAPGTPALIAALGAAKYGADGDPWRWLGRSLAIELRATAHWLEQLDVGSRPRPIVVPMPSPWLRRFHRGIDHTGLLAIEVASGVRGRVRPWLGRSWGPTQVGVGRLQRRLVRDRMSPSVRWRLGRIAAGRRRIDPRRDVLVLDDVMTTGASLAAAASLLRKLGHHRVHAAVVIVHPRQVMGVVDDSSTQHPPLSEIS